MNIVVVSHAMEEKSEPRTIKQQQTIRPHSISKPIILEFTKRCFVFMK